MWADVALSRRNSEGHQQPATADNVLDRGVHSSECKYRDGHRLSHRVEDKFH